MTLIQRITGRVRRELVLNQNSRRIRSLRDAISTNSFKSNSSPVIFFNASTRLSGLSQNAGFSLISSLAMQAKGIPVIYLVCRKGLSHCVLGTDKDRPQTPPPCTECIRTSKMVFDNADIHSFKYSRDSVLDEHLSNLNLNELLEFEEEGFPLGALILPSLRWILRRHHLADDEGTRFLTREYMLSAWNFKKGI